MTFGKRIFTHPSNIRLSLLEIVVFVVLALSMLVLLGCIVFAVSWAAAG